MVMRTMILVCILPKNNICKEEFEHKYFSNTVCMFSPVSAVTVLRKQEKKFNRGILKTVVVVALLLMYNFKYLPAMSRYNISLFRSQAHILLSVFGLNY